MYTVFKKIRGTPQFWKDFQYDCLAKTRYFGVSTFFMTWSCAQFQWTHLIKIAARCSIPSETFSDEEIEAMDWSTKVNILKRNPVLVARQIDHIFQSVWNKVVMSGLHPIGQILNFDDRGEFQTRPEFHSLVKKVQTHHHTQTCKKKKGKLCRFDAPWPPTENTVISRANTDKESLQNAKDVVKKVCSVMAEITEERLVHYTLEMILDLANVSRKDYEEALSLYKSKATITYKR